MKKHILVLVTCGLIALCVVPAFADIILLNESDFNLDGRVDLYDFVRIRANFGATEGATRLTGDTNTDGKVDIEDYRDFVSQLGRGSFSTSGDTLLYDDASNLVVKIFNSDGHREIYTYEDGLFTAQEVMDADIIGAGDVIEEHSADGSYKVFSDFWNSSQPKYIQEYAQDSTLLITYEYDESGELIHATYEYNINQLTDDSVFYERSQINDDGYIVWNGRTLGTDDEIFLYNGSVIRQLTNDSYDDKYPQINSNGWIVWQHDDGHDSEIYLYNGVRTIRLTYNSYDDYYPRINSSGEVVWYGYDGQDYEIFLYDGANITQLTDNSWRNDKDPRINNNGDVVWCGNVSGTYEIFLYDGFTTTQLTNNYSNDYSPEINDNGDVVWYAYMAGSPDIFLYKNSTVTRLTGDYYDDFSPVINNDGSVVWARGAGNNKEIFFYDGSTIVQLTDNSYEDTNPVISNSGYVVWRGGDYGRAKDIFLYDGVTVRRISTNNGWNNESPQINAHGQVVWNENGEIFLAEPTYLDYLESGASPLTEPVEATLEEVKVESTIQGDQEVLARLAVVESAATRNTSKLTYYNELKSKSKYLDWLKN